MKKIFPLMCLVIGLVQLSFGQSELVVKKNGELTLIEVTENQNNIFFGEFAGSQAVTGILSQPNALHNTAFGSWSMRYLSTGDDNTALGSFALGGVRTGHSNVGVGRSALFNTNDGIWNIGIGSRALLKNIEGGGNVGIGTEALYEALLGFNTGVGHEAGRENTGEHNTFLGGWSGRNNLGSYNVFLGNDAGRNIMGSNKLVIENSDVDSTQALIYGEFDNNKLRFNAEVNINGAYTLPTTSGQESQVLMLNSTNEVVWDSLILIDQDSTNELIQLVGTGTDAILIVDAGGYHTIDLMVTKLVDVDEDTKIDVDMGSSDTDKIRFQIAGKESAVMQRNAHGTFRMNIIDSLENTAIGDGALLSNSTGIGNTAYSANALRFNQSGIGNVALGRAAMQYSVSGDYNTYVGDLAGFRNDGGNRNVGVGSLTLARNVVGSGNVALGRFAGYHETGSNKLYIANDSVGSDEALVYGEFDNQLLRVNGELNVNGDYSLPTDPATPGQSMIMGADGKLKWHQDLIKITDVSLGWGTMNTTYEYYTGLDTFTNVWTGYTQTPLITDEDYDTKIEVQDLFGPDIDVISFDVAGVEKMMLDSDDLTINAEVKVADKLSINLGNQAATHALDIKSTDSQTMRIRGSEGFVEYGGKINFGDDNYVYVEESSDDMLHIHANNIGIGKAPTSGAKLQVEGTININDQYTLPLTDGSQSEFMMTDGSGNTSWELLQVTLVADADNDTKIQVEKAADEDIIRFDLGGSENIRFVKNASNRARIEFDNNNFNTIVGKSAGEEITSGGYNTLIGNGSGINQETGNDNVFLGSYSGANNISGSRNVFLGRNSGWSETGSDKLYIDNSQTSEPLVYGDFSSNLFWITGNVGIGNVGDSRTTASGHKLSVKGKIACEEVRVQPDAEWPDYVFADEYKLMPLSDLKKSIAENRHLPNIPSATQVAAEGVEVGEMQRKMIEKIEELTLYVISLQEQIEELKKDKK